MNGTPHLVARETSQQSSDTQTESTVFIRVYDISKGKARTWSPLLLGKRIPGIWHTGVLAFEAEYFYATGIEKMMPSEVETVYQMESVASHFIGKTNKTKRQFSLFLLNIFHQFTPDTYDLVKWNCNHFTDLCTKFLCGGGIPTYILELPEMFSDSLLGRGYVSMAKMIRGDNPITTVDNPNHPRHSLPYEIESRNRLIIDAEEVESKGSSPESNRHSISSHNKSKDHDRDREKAREREKDKEREREREKEKDKEPEKADRREQDRRERVRREQDRREREKDMKLKQSPLSEGYFGDPEKTFRSKEHRRNSHRQRHRRNASVKVVEGDRDRHRHKPRDPRPLTSSDSSIDERVERRTSVSSESSNPEPLSSILKPHADDDSSLSPPRKMLPRLRPDVRTVGAILPSRNDARFTMPSFQHQPEVSKPVMVLSADFAKSIMATERPQEPPSPRPPAIHTPQQQPRYQPTPRTVSHPNQQNFLNIRNYQQGNIPFASAPKGMRPLTPHPQRPQTQSFTPPPAATARSVTPKVARPNIMTVANNTPMYTRPETSTQSMTPAVFNNTPVNRPPMTPAAAANNRLPGDKLAPSEASTVSSENMKSLQNKIRRGASPFKGSSPQFGFDRSPPFAPELGLPSTAEISPQGAKPVKMRALSPTRRCMRCGDGMSSTAVSCKSCGANDSGQHRPPQQLKNLPSERRYAKIRPSRLAY